MEKCLTNLERLQAGPAAGVPDLDRAVVRRRRQPGRVVREGDRPDRIAVALERLQAGPPFLTQSWLYYNHFQLFLKKVPDQAAGWAAHECRRIRLERIVLYYRLVVHDESVRVSD